MKKYLKNETEVIQSLKEGKEVFNGTTPYVYKMVDGIICYYDIESNKLCGINAFVSIGSAPYYIEEQEPLKIEVGKFYKTRDGRAAHCFFADECLDLFRFTINGLMDVVETNKDGEQIIPGRFENEKMPTDIVGYWEAIR